MNTSELTLKEKLLILSLGEKGIIGIPFLKPGLAGACILELIIAGKADEKEGKLILKNTKGTSDPLLDFVIEKISASSKPKTIKRWVTIIGNKPQIIKKFLIPKLLDKKLIKKERKRFLFFTYYLHPVKDMSRWKELLRSMRTYLKSRTAGDDELLFLLCGAIKLYPRIFSDKHDRKKAQKIFQELKKNNFVVKGVADTVQAVQAAVIASTIAASAAVTASTSGS